MNEEDLKFYNMQDKEELVWMCISRDNRIKSLEQKINQYENPDDLTLMYMWLDEKAKDKMKDLQQRIDKAIEKLNSFINCCKCEKLESGSDYLHHQYWNMFENFNKQVKEILKGGNNE